MTRMEWRWARNPDLGGHYVGGTNILNLLTTYEKTETRILEGRRGDEELWTFLLSLDRANDSYCEAFSPYGYSKFGNNGLLSGDDLNDLRKFLQSENVIDLFIRHNPWEHSQSIFPDGLNEQVGSVFRLELNGFSGDQESDFKAVPQKRRSTLRRSIRAGVDVVITPAHLATSSQQSEFVRIYRESMKATGAGKFYYFNVEFFQGLFLDANNSLYLFEALSAADGGVVASAIFVGDECGVAHYFLSGSLPEGKLQNATDLVIFRAAQHFAARGFDQLNLGGATVIAGSGLAAFKKAWSTSEQPYFVSKIVCDSERYWRLRGAITEGDPNLFLLRDLITGVS
jgi:hypothetical protein